MDINFSKCYNRPDFLKKKSILWYEMLSNMKSKYLMKHLMKLLLTYDIHVERGYILRYPVVCNTTQMGTEAGIHVLRDD